MKIFFFFFIVLGFSTNLLAQQKCTLIIANKSFELNSNRVNDTTNYELPRLYLTFNKQKENKSINKKLKVNNLSKAFSDLKDGDKYQLVLPYGTIKAENKMSESVNRIIYAGLTGQFPYGVVNIGCDLGPLDSILQINKIVDLKIGDQSIPLKSFDLIVVGENIIRYQVNRELIDLKSIMDENKDFELLIIDKLKFENVNIRFSNSGFMWRR